MGARRVFRPYFPIRDSPTSFLDPRVDLGHRRVVASDFHRVPPERRVFKERPTNLLCPIPREPAQACPNSGNGTFAAKVEYTLPPSSFLVAAEDLNSDGRPDLAVTNLNSNTVSVLLLPSPGPVSGERRPSPKRSPWRPP
jgi:hypothetical protein